jgi:ketosteroid isomerase-like protein
MGAAENSAAVRRGYDAFSRGDMDTLRELFTPNVKWHENGRTPTSGDFEGVDSVLANFGQLAAETGGTFRVEIHDLLASEDHVVVLGRSSADRGGRHFDGNYCHVFHFSGDKVSESWVVNQDTYALDEFFSG